MDTSSKSIEPLLTDVVINEISALGSLLILALSLDLLDIKKFKLVNYLPAVFFPILYYVALYLLK
jgi:uncharacterized membrane protein YqgA involved in biofilm formation